ncbi:MAG TPA: DUF5689 domain-containing protein [Saprospiraceae bacterium]|nr:DUF5689 domain-containing protein [Saprospiraceae bacterium]HPI07088.1 DUF5689 domain-containing protein [Saprospiraceae bacterium]
MFFAKNKNRFFAAIAVLSLALGITACVKTEFDEPPVGGEPVTLTTNKTIAELKALHVTAGGFDKITEDIIIGGEVVMDDRSGNYYKTLVIQDASGGIEIKFNDGFLFQQYPLGRTLYIRCKDLILTDYNNLTQLIGSTVEENGVLSDVGLTEAQARSKVVKGPFATTPLAPKEISISDLNPSLISTFVRLSDVQFAKLDTAKTYADPVTQFSLNRTIEDCSHQQLLVRTSGFSDFASQLTPTGKGYIEGVLNVFGTTYQLALRNASGAQMTGTRCGASTGTETSIDISAIRSIFTGTTTSAPANRKIKGIVISDRLGKNLNNRNLYIQDGTAGIVVRFDAEHFFNLGDEIEVIISEQEISEFNKLLQLNNVPVDNAVVVSTGNTLTPRIATIAEINTNFNAWESTLVTIVNATITGGATLSGNRTVNDGTGSIAMFTQTAATFSGTATPAAPVTLTAIVSDFNAKQIIMRNANDIQQ